MPPSCSILIVNEGTVNLLYENIGDGRFSRLLAGELVTSVSARARSAAWADIDDDGDLDLVVAGYADMNFYRNDAADYGTYVEFGAALVLAQQSRNSLYAAWADVNNGAPQSRRAPCHRRGAALLGVLRAPSRLRQQLPLPNWGPPPWVLTPVHRRRVARCLRRQPG